MRGGPASVRGTESWIRQSTHTHTVSPIQAWLLVILAVGIVVSLVSWVPDPGDAPLPWDMSKHTLRSTQMAATLATGDWSALADQLRRRDLYPPAAYLEVAALQAVLGSNGRAWRGLAVLGWVGLLAAMGLAAERAPLKTGILGLLLVGANGLVLSLSGQRMLDFPGAVAAVLALAGLSRLATRPSWRVMVLAAFLVSGALLTKHNAGLPVVLVGVVLAGHAGLRGKRGSAWTLLVAVLGGLLVWAAFLTWQDHGWEAFFSFARNRANSQGTGMMQRAWDYLGLFFGQYHGGWIRGGGILALAVLGLASRSRLAWACFLYAGATLLAIARHPYFLSRNFTSAAVALAVAAAIGLWFLLRSGRALGLKWWPGFGVAVLVLGSHGLQTSMPQAREVMGRSISAATRDLGPASRTLEEWIQSSGRVLVLGTFNQLSRPWVQALFENHRRPGARILVDLDYPLARQREGLDPAWDPRYAEVFAATVEREVTREVLVIEQMPGSPWLDEDFRAWNSFKANYIRCVRSSGDFREAERREFPGAGLILSRFVSTDTRVRPEEGWLPEEEWGRWMSGPRASLLLPAGTGGKQLLLEVSPHPDQVRPLILRLGGAGLEERTMPMAGPAWKWQKISVPLNGAVPGGRVHLEILDHGLEGDPGRRWLPFRSFGVTAEETAKKLGPAEAGP